MLRFLCQFALLLRDKQDDDLVDERSVGFHDVVGERECVVVVAVENSEGGEEAAPHEGARGCRAEYRVTIVQKIVWVFSETVADKRAVYNAGVSNASRMLKIMQALSLEAEKAGVSDISLDEINAEIDAARNGR